MSWQAGPHPDDPPRPVVQTAQPFVPRRMPVLIRPRADTRHAVTLELLPLLPVALSMMAVLFAGGWSVASVAGFAVLTSVGQVVVAVLDVRELRRRGFAGLPSALLALLSPILYLLVRARRCSGLDPDAGAPVRWAIGTTVTAIVLVLIGMGFQAAISPVFTYGG